jgi:hypothetical protein
MTEPLAAAYLAISGFILVWNTFRAGRIASARTAPPAFAALSALGGLLLVPALLVRLASANALYARSIEAITWVWPLTLALFAAQAIYAAVRRMSHPVVAVVIAVYDVMLLLAGLTEYALVVGVPPPDPALAILAAHRNALALVATPAALASTAWVQLPLLAPAFPARWTVSIASRGVVAALAFAVVVVTGSELRAGYAAVRSYAPLADERLRERPAGDLAIGAELFPSLASLPPPLAVRNDLAIADSLGAEVVSLVLEPAATRPAVLDSLRRAFEGRRRGGMLLVVTLGWARGPIDAFRKRRPLDVDARVASVQRIAQRLEPDYLLPAHEPYGAAARAVGTLPPERWRTYLEAAAHAVDSVNRRVRVAYAVAAYDARDSVLYAWAAADGSPMDAVGFILRPTRHGGASLREHMATAERWIAAAESGREHWVFGVAGLPMVHGERSQRLAIEGALAWATRQEGMRGVIIANATDYTMATGLRSSLGRLRPALAAAQRSAQLVRETALGDTLPAPVTR